MQKRLTRWLLASSLLMIVGCAQRPIKLVTPCTSQSTSDLIAALTALVVSEGMNVTLVNEKVGILQASSAEDRSIWTGATTSNHWTFTVREGKVEPIAKSLTQTKNAFGATLSSSETYYTDKADQDWKWYWNVRNGLQTLCGSQVRITVDASWPTRRRV
jgi:hypothetical protein